MQHLFHHGSMVSPVSIEKIYFCWFLLFVDMPEHSCKTGVIGSQVNCSHSIAIFYLVRGTMGNQSLSDIFVAELCCIM